MRYHTAMTASDLYIVQIDIEGSVKVGRSSDVKRRRNQLQTACPHLLKIILHVPNAGHREKDLHRRMRYRSLKHRGEWFSPDALDELPADLYERLDLENRDWWIRI